MRTYTNLIGKHDAKKLKNVMLDSTGNFSLKQLAESMLAELTWPSGLILKRSVSVRIPINIIMQYALHKKCLKKINSGAVTGERVFLYTEVDLSQTLNSMRDELRQEILDAIKRFEIKIVKEESVELFIEVKRECEDDDIDSICFELTVDR